MKRAIRESYDSIKLDNIKKQQMLNSILNEYAAKVQKQKKFRKISLTAIMACAVAAAIFAVVFLSSGNINKQFSAYVPQASKAACASAVPEATTGPYSLIACRVTLSINPSVEFQIGEDGLVVTVVGLNEDGVALIEGIDFAGLSMENATIIVINRLIQEGYISASMVNDVYISVSGSPQTDTLTMMSTIIKSAALKYEVSVDTVQTQDNELQIVVGEKDVPEITPTPDVTHSEEPTPAGSPIPTDPAGTDALPAALSLKYLKDLSGGVDDISVRFDDGSKNSYIRAYVDIAGKPVEAATFFTLIKLINDGYITDERPDTRIEFDVSAFGKKKAANVRELAGLMAQEAGLALDAADEGGGRFCLAASGMPAPERTAKYTLAEIDDPKVIKAREDVTELQMQILEMAFTADEIDYMLTPRYWTVMPDIIGLDEARAAELLRLAGFKPIPSYEDGYHAADVEYGKVFFYDGLAGGLAEVGSRIPFAVRAHSMPTLGTDDLPKALQYLPAFLGDTGYTTVTVNRQTGMGVPIAFRQEGLNVVIHAFGGCWKNADGLYLWGEQYIDTSLDEVSAYWAADNGDGDDVPVHADLRYEIYREGEYVASVAVRLNLLSSAEEDTLTYEALVTGFGEDGPYNYIEGPMTKPPGEKRPPEITRYFPSFLDDTGENEVSLTDIPSGGKGIPFTLKEGWEVELRVRTGSLVDLKNNKNSTELRFVNEPGNDFVYWTPGDDIPERAFLLYFVYEDGKVIKIGIVGLVFPVDRGGVITYTAYMPVFRENGIFDEDLTDFLDNAIEG